MRCLAETQLASQWRLGVRNLYLIVGRDCSRKKPLKMTILTKKTLGALLRGRSSRCLTELKKSLGAVPTSDGGFEHQQQHQRLGTSSAVSSSTANWACEEVVQKYGLKSHEEIYRFSIEKVRAYHDRELKVIIFFVIYVIICYLSMFFLSPALGILEFNWPFSVEMAQRLLHNDGMQHGEGRIQMVPRRTAQCRRCELMLRF